MRTFQEMTDFLLSYYPKADCENAGFLPYEYSARGTIRRAAVLCPKAGTGLSIKLAMGDETASLEERHSDPTIGDFDVDHVARCLAAMPHRGEKMWNDEVYRLIRYQADKELHAVFGRTRFLRYRLTVGLMREELQISEALPLRQSIAPTAAALLNFPGRLAVGGMQMLCAFARPAPWNDFAVALQVRSKDVGEGGGNYGVVPMGVHQTSMIAGHDPLFVSTTALRELYEEVFGGEEVPSGSLEMSAIWQHPAMEWLARRFRKVHFEMTSLAVSMIHGNYDFTLLLAIPDTEFWTKFGSSVQAGWESSSHLLLSSKNGKAFPDLLANRNWEPQAVVALVEGMKRLHQIDPSRVDFVFD